MALVGAEQGFKARRKTVISEAGDYRTPPNETVNSRRYCAADGRGRGVNEGEKTCVKWVNGRRSLLFSGRAGMGGSGKNISK